MAGTVTQYSTTHRLRRRRKRKRRRMAGTVTRAISHVHGDTPVEVPVGTGPTPRQVGGFARTVVARVDGGG